MRILIFSWRDIKNPKSGGAEILTYELAKRWVKMGHQTTLLCASFPGAKNRQIVEGITIYRPASFYHYSPLNYLTYLFKTIKFYRQSLSGKIDLVLDQVHGLPLFTPVYVKEKVVIFPLEVAKEIWSYEVPFPFWICGWLLEFLYLKIFSHHPFITISPSTACDLRNLGVRRVQIITPGVKSSSPKTLPQKTRFPLLVCLGRLTPMKRIEQTLLTLKLVVNHFPETKLQIVGRGQDTYVQKLKNLTRKLGLEKQVIFTGYVSEGKKIAFLTKSWVLVSTSLREGWGLNVIEAAACGTPAVAYRIPGLSDSIKDGLTGITCKENCPEELAKNIIRLFVNHRLRTTLSKNALEYSRNFSWDQAANKTLEILKSI